MKLELLHLKAFGAFTGRTLDLSGGREGFHLIHGPNEAGKSTALRAITQLLYGIETRTADDFVHPMKNLRIGATVANGKDTLAFFRRKGNKNTLLAADGKKALPDDALAPFLAGVDAAAFTNFFGLSHEQLVRGGQGLVQGEGDVGQALFSAAAGMGHLRVLLNHLEEAAGDLFKPSASKPRINSALAQWKALRKEIKAIQLSSSEWQALDEDRRAAEERRAALDASLREARAEQERLKRLQDALPLIARRAMILEQFAPCQNAPLLPGDFPERRQTYQTSLLQAESARESASKARAAHEKELDAVVVNEALLAREGAIEELNERRAENRKALADRDKELAPALARLQTDLERDLHHVRPHWALDQAEDLRLAPGQEQRIHELSREGEALKERHANAEAALKKLRRERDRVQEALASFGPTEDPGGVERALKEVAGATQLGEDLAEQQRRATTLERAIEAGIARLGMWSGPMEALESLPVPAPATIERFRVGLEDAIRSAEEAAIHVESLETELRQAEAEMAAYHRSHDTPSVAQLEERRHTRQEGWRFARAAWEDGVPPKAVADKDAQTWLKQVQDAHPDAETLADAFAATMDSADATADRLRNEADRVAVRAQREAEIASLRERLDKAHLAREEQAAALKALEEEWCAAWNPAGINPRSPREMAEWKQAHTGLLDDLRAQREAESAAAALAERKARYRAQLTEALLEIGAEKNARDGSLENLIACAESWVEQQRHALQERRQQEASLTQLDGERIPHAEEALESATLAWEAWCTEWATLAEDLGAPATASSGEILALVKTINDILAGMADAADLRGRIERIERDDEAFRNAVRSLAESADYAGNESDEAALVQAIYADLQQSRMARQDRDRLQKLRDTEAVRLREAEAALAEALAGLKALCNEAEVDDTGDLPAAENASAERQRLEAALREVEEQLAGLSAGSGLDGLLAMAAEEEADTLAHRLDTLGTDIEDLDDERLEVRERLGRLDEQLKQMDGSDAAAALETEAQSMLAAIADDAEEYARRRIAAHVLRAAIEQYRAANQEPLLARAGAIFRRLTQGSFAELQADVNEKDEHVLCGVRAENGALVTVGGMSEGTADQLYLALRLASLERHLESHPPVPFVLDDILVNFDDARATAALKVLAEVSDRTQVIYFTHHQHLVQLAKDCVDKKQLFVQSLAG